MRRAIIVALALLTLTPPARAERAGAGAAQRTGIELFISSGETAYYGRTHKIRGTAYEVRGLADLRQLPGARVRARCGGDWAEVSTGNGGFFELDLPVPEDPRFGARTSPHLDIEIHHGQDSRDFVVPISLHSPVGVTARTDRNEYEPGETVHLWVRVFDVQTGRPLPGMPVRTTAGADSPAVELRPTSAAGITTLDIPIDGERRAHQSGFSVVVGPEGRTTSAALSYRVGERPTTDLFVSVVATPETAAPGEAVTLRIQVRSPSGFPVQGARVELRNGDQSFTAVTDIGGTATIELNAPAYTSSQRGRVALTGHVYHPGYGRVNARGSFEVTAPESMEVFALLPRGGLVPEVRDRLILNVRSTRSSRGAAGTPVEVRGPAVEGGSASATVDRHGYASIPMRASVGSYARHVGNSRCNRNNRRAATTIQVTLRGDVPQEVELCVDMLEHALVAPSLRSPVAAPGETVEVTLARRRQVARRPVVVELLHHRANQIPLVLSTVVGPAATRATLTLPADRTGLFYVRARPLLELDGDAAEGTAAITPLLVRPVVPTFPRLELDAEQYTIRGRANLTVHSPANAPRSYAAVLVRDLAQHQGEEPFREYFLGRALWRAILDPDTPEADLLIRARLAGYALEDGLGPYDRSSEPLPDVSRDPVQLGAELRQERAGQWMVAIEQLLFDALQSDTVTDITTGAGARRRFNSNVVDLALEAHGNGDGPARTLGDSPVTPAMLTAVDSSFDFERVARRVARRRLVRLLGVLAAYVDPEGNAEHRPRGRATEPPDRWLSELVRRGVVRPAELRDPWGGTFVLRQTGRTPAFTIAVEAEGYELVSPGPDGRVGTADDVRDPLARVVPAGTTYARASGEDRLMAQLSALSPGAEALDDLIAAYARLNDEALEELQGDAMGASGIAGYGSGYGSGHGSLRGRRARAPAVRMGRTSIRSVGPLASIVREDFPATLLFVPELAIDGSGRTRLEIPLADAPTTYIVEAILWREDGWVWSASTRLRVDQELIVDAPVPAHATVGDDIVLPVRVANRTKTARVVQLRVTGSDELGIEPVKLPLTTVPASDAIEVPALIPLRHVAKGRLTIAALTKQNTPLDAVRRKIRVRRPQRRATDAAETLVEGRGEVAIGVPEGAEPIGANRVVLTAGGAIFRRGEHESWDRWIDGLANAGLGMNGAPVTDWEQRELAESAAPLLLAQLVGADWLSSAISNRTMDRALGVLFDHVTGVEVTGADHLRRASRMLLLLAPAHVHAEERPGLRRALGRVIRELRIKVENGSSLFADSPWLSARVAAALLWTANRRDADARAREMLGRARAAVVTVNEERWLEGGRDDSGDELFVASCLLALAEIRDNRRDEAFQLVRSMARLLRSGGAPLPEVRSLRAEDRVLAAAAAEALGSTRELDDLTLRIDGERHEVQLEEGIGIHQARALGEGGEHRIVASGAGRALLLVRAEAQYSVDWNVPPPHVGPLVVSISDEGGTLDRRSGLHLIVRNRVPRMVRMPVVEIALPAGVEVDEEARRRMRHWLAGPIDVSPDTLTLRLRPLGPRGSVRVPLPWSWTTAGQLNGLGVTGYAADRQNAISLSPPRRIEITHPRSTPGGAP